MFFLSNPAYSVAPDGVLTDWSNVTELLNRKKEKEKKNTTHRRNNMDSLCIYPTVFTNQMSMIFVVVLYLLIFLGFFVLFWFLLKPGPPLPCVHTLHVQQHHSDSCFFLLFVCLLLSRLLAIKIKARY